MLGAAATGCAGGAKTRARRRHAGPDPRQLPGALAGDDPLGGQRHVRAPQQRGLLRAVRHGHQRLARQGDGHRPGVVADAGGRRGVGLSLLRGAAVPRLARRRPPRWPASAAAASPTSWACSPRAPERRPRLRQWGTGSTSTSTAAPAGRHRSRTTCARPWRPRPHQSRSDPCRIRATSSSSTGLGLAARIRCCFSVPATRPGTSASVNPTAASPLGRPMSRIRSVTT